MLEAWLWLIHLKGFSLSAKHILLEHLGSPEGVMDLKPRQLTELVLAAGGRLRSPVAIDRSLISRLVARDVALIHRLGARFVGISDADFPLPLRQIEPAPLGLFVLGNYQLLKSYQVALVGSRMASRGGMMIAAQFAADLTAAGVTVTSGLARGIDGSAHRGALDVGGNTLAVVANGIDRIYPESNRALREEIAQHGLLVSEYPPGSEPRRAHFPQRNRIISGLSRATVVVEAGLRSGSLITARLAAEQGREVFAVPGSIHSPGSRGCHHLLRQGAALAESAADVLAELGIGHETTAESATTISPELSGDIQRIYDLLEHTPCPLDEIIEHSGLTTDQVSSILIRLELQGLVSETSGGYLRLPSGRPPA